MKQINKFPRYHVFRGSVGKYQGLGYTLLHLGWFGGRELKFDAKNNNMKDEILFVLPRNTYLYLLRQTVHNNHASLLNVLWYAS